MFIYNQHCAANQHTLLSLLRVALFSPTCHNIEPFPAGFTYLDVGGVPLAVPPRAADAREGSLWMVELVIVGVEEKCGEGLLQAQEREKSISGDAWGPLECVQTTAQSQRSQACEAGTYYSQHPHQRRVSCGVKGCVVVGRGAVVVPRLVALCVKRCPLGIQCSDWLEETTEEEVGGYKRTQNWRFIFFIWHHKSCFSSRQLMLGQ